MCKNYPGKDTCMKYMATVFGFSQAIVECLKRDKTYGYRDLVPIISALEYNTWFTKLRASHIKLSHEAIDRILHIMKKNLTIEELYLDNLGVKWYVC